MVYRRLVIRIASPLLLIIMICVTILLHHQNGSSVVLKNCEFLGRLRGPVAGDDPQVISHLRSFHLFPPATLPYNLTNPGDFKFSGFSWPFIYHHVNHFFGDQRGGFFVEAGALDGEFLSNTLWLERQLGWSGLLVEPSSENFRHLEWKRRKAWITNTCFSDSVYPKEGLFGEFVPEDRGGMSFPWMYRANFFEIRNSLHKTFDWTFQSHIRSYNAIQCFPLETYLMALNVTTVDFMSLDIQGGEWEVLKTLAKTNVTVRALVVEHYPAHGKQYVYDPAFVRYMTKEAGFHLVDCDAEPNYFFIIKSDKELMEKTKRKDSKSADNICQSLLQKNGTDEHDLQKYV